MSWFLSPWSNVLRGFAAADATVSSSGTLRRRIDHVDIHLPTQQQHATMSPVQLQLLREAIELVGRALVVDVTLWKTIPMAKPHQGGYHQYQTPTVFVDPRAFGDDADLVPAFEFVCENAVDDSVFREWLATVRKVICGDDTTVRDASDAFVVAKQQLQRMDHFNVAALESYHVPVSLRVTLASVAATSELASMLETVASSDVASSLRLTHVDLVVADLQDTLLTEPLLRIHALSEIAVRTITLEQVASAALVRQWCSFSNKPLHSLTLQSRRGASFSSGFCMALLWGLSPTHVQLQMPLSMDPDWLLVVRALCESRVDHIQITWPNLTPDRVAALAQALRIASATTCQTTTFVRVDPATDAGQQLLCQLEATQSVGQGVSPEFAALVGERTALLQLADGQQMEVDRTSIHTVDGTLGDNATESSSALLRWNQQHQRQQRGGRLVDVHFSTGLCASDDLPILVTCIQTCFGDRVRSLELHVVTDAVFTAEIIAQILAVFPVLECLKFSHTALTNMNVFADAYRDHQRCSKLRVLWIDSGDIGFLPFFEELATPCSVAALTLQELRVAYPRGDTDDADGHAFLQGITTMLTHNRVLQFLELVVATTSPALIERIARALRAHHRTPLAVPARHLMPLKAKLAFLSVFGTVSAVLGQYNIQ